MERIRRVKPKFTRQKSGAIMMTFFNKDLAPVDKHGNKTRSTGRYTKSIGLRLESAWWNSKNNNLVNRAGKHEEYKEYQQELNKWVDYVEQIFDHYNKSEIKASKELIDADLKKLQRNQNVANKGNLTLLEYIKDWIDSPKKHYYIKNGNHVKYSGGAMSSKIRAYEILSDFDKKHTLDFHTITKGLYDDIREFLETNFKVNTQGKIFKELKFFLNQARGDGYNIPPAHKHFLAYSEPSSDEDSIAIPIKDILEIYRTDLSPISTQDRDWSKQKELYRDWFVLGCFCGLRVSDLLSLDNSKNIITLRGAKWIKKKTGKTGKEVFIKFSPIISSIIEKYNGFPPKVTEQKLNKHIKTIFKYAEFDYSDKVKTHCMRRSFCTNAYLESENPNVEKIMQISGHTTLKSFLLYIRISEAEHAIRLQETAFFEEVSPLTITKAG